MRDPRHALATAGLAVIARVKPAQGVALADFATSYGAAQPMSGALRLNLPGFARMSPCKKMAVPPSETTTGAGAFCRMMFREGEVGKGTHIARTFLGQRDLLWPDR